MAALKMILTIVFVIVCIALAVIVLLQEGKANGLGAISGAADTYWGKNKGRSMEGKLEKGTKLLVIAFFVFAILLNIPSITNPGAANASTGTTTPTSAPTAVPAATEEATTGGSVADEGNADNADDEDSSVSGEAAE